MLILSQYHIFDPQKINIYSAETYSDLHPYLNLRICNVFYLYSCLLNTEVSSDSTYSLFFYHALFFTSSDIVMSYIVSQIINLYTLCTCFKCCLPFVYLIHRRWLFQLLYLYFQVRIRPFLFFMYFLQPCFICRPPDSIVSENAGIEPRARIRVSPFRLKKIFACKRNKANLDPFHMCFTFSL